MTQGSLISDYAIIGDGRSAALVSRAGSIDWLCWPRFESASLFCALLDPSAGGWWKIAPTETSRTRRSYLSETNVLVTEFESPDGLLRLTDLMPVYSEEDKKHGLVPEHELLRVVECVRGTSAFFRNDIESRSWSESLQTYTQIQHGHTVDASLLLMSWYGYTTPSHPRMRATFRRIQERLQVAPGLLYRNEESLTEREGAFGICSFWAAEYLARGGGSLEEAEVWFENVLRYANDVGILAEEMDPSRASCSATFRSRSRTGG